MTTIPNEGGAGHDSAKVERFDDDGNRIDEHGNPIEDEGERSDAEHN